MAIRMPSRRPQRPEDFIADASAAPSSPQRPDLPWLDPKVRPDLRLQLNAKLPEPLMLQLEYLHKNLSRPKQTIIEEALRNWVQKQLRSLDLPES
ncbi:hypothetical protein [Roseomonas marmotae]|uniref:Ribbon-helix-helix protein, CopG family n=1 Tax=Roseomonas marmotae TaxID=2768161 RepID=A0ABS3KIL0_9PROT|nr:hypothetical protein [Roseomonas marmotae]MBO1077299.1 hypothetical protein [Roseomonas marmotae]QTI81108.1 hypothetical protein IAI58_17230 [Roseomonas marmotae]